MYRSSYAMILLAVACSFLLAGAAPSPAAGADEKTGEDARANSLSPGSWSLQFQITDELGLKPFNGMMVSVKRHWSRQSALRLGVQVSAGWTSSTDTDSQEVADTLYRSDDQSADYNYQKLTIDLSYVRYPWPGSHVNLFWGVGPLVSFSRDEQTDVTIYSYDDRDNLTSRYVYRRSWELGAVGLVGVEWFLSKNFSFHSEYRSSITYGRSIETVENSQSYMDQRSLSERESDGWDFRGANVTLGLSVYF